MNLSAFAVGALVSAATLPVLGQTFTGNSQIFDPPLLPATSISSVSLADFNGDGRLDFYFPGALYRQQSNGWFKEVLGASGIDSEGDAPRGGIFGDANFDGLLDLFIMDSVPGSKVFFNRNGGKFELGNFVAGIQLTSPPIGGFWRDLNSDGWLDFTAVYRQGNHALLTGFPNGRYSDQGAFYAFRSSNQTCSLAPADYDKDGDVDVYVSACTAPNELLNQSGSIVRPRYFNSASIAGVASSQRSKEAVWFDYDNDGWLDMLVANDFQELTNFSDNLLYHNEGNGRFVDRAAQAGITGGRINAGPAPLVVADFDNDGWQDVYLPINGVGKLYHNNKNGTFTDIYGAATGLFLAPGVTQAGDFNNDGWMDLFFPGEGILYNDGGSNNWITIEVKEDARNRFGVGATLRLTTGAGIQTRVIEAGTGGLGHGDQLKAHFGLGTATEASKLEIVWPTGASETYSNLAANNNYVFVRGIGRNEPPSAFTQTMPLPAGFIEPSAEKIRFEWQVSQDLDPVKYTLSVSGPGIKYSFPDLEEPFFELSAALLPVDQVYEWSVRATDGHSVRYSGEERQFTFGQAGNPLSTFREPVGYDFGFPKVSEGVARFADVDGDRDLDLLFGGEGPISGILSLYLTEDRIILLPNDGGSYVFKAPALSSIPLKAVKYPKTAFGDVTNNGRQDLIVSGISTLNKTPETSVYLNTGTGFNPFSSNAIPNVWSGAVEWGDVDGDGDTDLLVAGAKNLTAPFNAVTQIILNEGNLVFREAGANLPGIAFGDASWGDMDGDGDLDIALTGDKGGGELYTGIFRNDDGQFVDIHAGLPPLLDGSLAWADFDVDGDLDLFVTGGKIDPGTLLGQSILFVNQNGRFERHPFPFDGILSGEAVWGDYENDGDPDLYISGSSSPFGRGVGRLFRNENGQFAAEIDLVGLRNASVAFGDYNGDKDMDLVILGRDDDGVIQVRFMINQQIPELIPPR
ncbi:MAG: VCBS repeat-containing protein [Bacteroidetes bacterium]|nr:VCBS repeat-containing protein [Bacteroidota bacterium]